MWVLESDGDLRVGVSGEIIERDDAELETEGEVHCRCFAILFICGLKRMPSIFQNLLRVDLDW